MTQAGQSRTLIRPRFLGAALLCLASSCGGPPLDGSGLDVDQLCALTAAGDVDAVVAEVSRQANVPRDKIRVTPSGVYAPVKTSFAEEAGYFLAKPGWEEKQGTDPGFTRIKGCLYRYKIKG